MLDTTLASQQTRTVYTVSQLNTQTRLLLEGHFPRLWISGEISNLATPQSGHLYFSLKDSRAQVRCALFRSQKNLLGFAAENGLQVLVQAKVSLYEGRGDYQLIIDYMEPMGDGLLRQAYERLKAQLHSEGLFDPQHKKPLPQIPKTVGIITSATGAAVRDILSVLKRRFPAIDVNIYPCQVQGNTAANSIISALQYAEQHNTCDVLILARGGGSLEDLQAFNEERVARTLFACKIPVVTGVGHEVDTTIVDYIADCRGATPTAAAELVSPDQWEWRQHIQNSEQRLVQAVRKILQQLQQRLHHYRQRLRHPQQAINENRQRLDNTLQRLLQAPQHIMQRHQSALQLLSARLTQHHPQHLIQSLQASYQNQQQQLIQQMNIHLQQARHQLQLVCRALDTVSPLATLNRGYAIVFDQQGQVIRDTANVSPGETIETQLASGRLICQVSAIKNSGPMKS